VIMRFMGDSRREPRVASHKAHNTDRFL